MEEGTKGEAGVGPNLTAAVGMTRTHATRDPAGNAHRHLRGAHAGWKNQDVIPNAHLAIRAAIPLEGHSGHDEPFAGFPASGGSNPGAGRVSKGCGGVNNGVSWASWAGPSAVAQGWRAKLGRAFTSGGYAAPAFPVDAHGLLRHTSPGTLAGIHGTTFFRSTILLATTALHATTALAAGRHGGHGYLCARTRMGTGDVQLRAYHAFREDLVEQARPRAG